MKDKLIIATVKEWNVVNASKFTNRYREKYDVLVASSREELNCELVNKFKPKYIFFPHWSWFIPNEIFDNYNCIGFHMTDLPYGRGGSPLQNLIARKVYNTKISAIRVVNELDAGDIYIKEDFYIGSGSARELFQKASDIIFFKMIPHILENNPMPCRQEGEVISFKRRWPEESDLTNLKNPSPVDFYDVVRMLDADSYPKAFLKIGDLKIEFSDINKEQDKYVGKFEVTHDHK